MMGGQVLVLAGEEEGALNDGGARSSTSTSQGEKEEEGRSCSDRGPTSPLPSSSLSGRLGAAATPAQRPGTPWRAARDCPRRPP